MNSHDIVLLLIVLVPVALLTWLRINSAIVFLSLCLGDVLMQFVSPDAHEFLALFSAHVPNGADLGNNIIRIILLLLPVVLTCVFMFKTVKGHNRFLNILPAIGVGVLGGLLVTPLLSTKLSSSIIDSPIWIHLKNNQGLAVGLSAIVTLAVLWLERPKVGSKKDKHTKHS